MHSESARTLRFGLDENAFHTTESAVGRVLYERFLIEREIGDPAFAGFFRSFVAKDLKHFCRPVIFKSCDLPKTDLAEDDSPSYQHLCSVVIRLEHPNIEPIIEAGELPDGRLYSVSDFVEGQTLADRLAAGKRLSLEQVAEIVDRLSEVLAAAHSRNVLHCDINPSNVIIPAREGFTNLRLINFGTAWPIDLGRELLADDHADASRYQYAAPERLVRLGQRSPASDVYSLSALAYRLLTGNAPFEFSDREELLEAIAAAAVEPPSNFRTDLGRETERLILYGLQFEAAGRPHDIEDFGSRLSSSLRPLSYVLPSIKAPVMPEQNREKFVRLSEDSDKNEIAGSINTLNRIPSKTPPVVSDRWITWSLIVLLLAWALSIPIGQTLLADSKDSKNDTTLPHVTAKASENVQKRQIRFATDSAFSHLTLFSDGAGDLYVFREIAAQNAGTEFRMVHPSGAQPASIEAGKQVRINLTDRSDLTPVKAIWIVWTGIKVSGLESIKTNAGNGVISAEDTQRLRHFLERNRNLRIETTTDQTNGQTLLNGTNDKMVYRISVKPN